jgi:tetratricopeptide (TPR) repeat protein
LEKAIEIKRRAQRCILNGDLNGALAEYEKLVASGDPDPYYSVLLADLLYKKGEAGQAQRRYHEAVEGYEKQGLYKNAIAVCKKMSRLSFNAAEVLRRLAALHALDGLPTEASLYYLQHAEMLIKQDDLEVARTSLKQAYEVSPDNIKALERLGELEVLAGDTAAAELAWTEAADRYDAIGQRPEAKRWRNRAEQIRIKGGRPAALRPGGGQAPPPGGTASADDEAPDTNAALGLPELELGSTSKPAEVAEPEVEAAPGPPPLPAHLATRAPAAPTPATPAAARPPSAPPPAAAPPSYTYADEPAGLDRPISATNTPGASSPLEAEDDVIELPREHERETPGAAPSRLGLAGLDPSIFERHNPSAAAPDPRANGMPDDESAAEGSGLGIERLGDGEPQPGLDFGGPTRGSEPAHPPATDAAELDPGLAEVSQLLKDAQNKFTSGNRTAATVSLVRAAQAYDNLGRFDSAAAIYRSLGHSTDSSLQLMMLWLKNCQRRNDRREAARVACDLGDRSINEGDLSGAREWFERAQSYDPENEMAPRRLKHLDTMKPSGVARRPAAPPAAAPPAPAPPAPPRPAARPPAPAPAPLPPRAPEPAAPPDGYLHIRTDRDDPVIIDLGTLISEFQREAGNQLAADPQGHYDLGMSYREMGLLEQAIESFRVAAEDPAFLLRAKELIGRCLLDLGHFDEAANELQAALRAPDLRPSVAHDLRYQLGLALEAAGRSAEALAEFERVYAAQANYPDVAMKIRILRKTVGAT